MTRLSGLGRTPHCQPKPTQCGQQQQETCRQRYSSSQGDVVQPDSLGNTIPAFDFDLERSHIAQQRQPIGLRQPPGCSIEADRGAGPGAGRVGREDIQRCCLTASAEFDSAEACMKLVTVSLIEIYPPGLPPVDCQVSAPPLAVHPEASVSNVLVILAALATLPISTEITKASMIFNDIRPPNNLMYSISLGQWMVQGKRYLGRWSLKNDAPGWPSDP